MEAITTALPAAITETFGELHFNKAIAWRGLGAVSYVYDFAFTAGYANIFHNAKGLMRLSIDHKEYGAVIDENAPVTVEASLMDHRYRNAGIKFRKISAKTPAEAVAKIIAWYEKNAEAMKAIDFS